MRNFLNAILAFIGSTSLTDDEFDSINLDDETYTVDAYTQLLAILDAREMVSGTRDRLKYYFLARGVTIDSSLAEKSNIFIGGSTCS